jgi:hypothetical protein
VHEGRQNKPQGEKKGGDDNDPLWPEAVIEFAHHGQGKRKDYHIDHKHQRNGASAPTEFPDDRFEHYSEGV